MAPFRRIVGSSLRLEMDPEGKVRHVVALAQWLATIIGSEPGPAGEILAQQFNEGFVEQLADFGKAFPSSAVLVGQSWPYRIDLPAGDLGTIAAETTMTLVRLENHEPHRLAVIESKGTLKSVPHSEADPKGGMSLDEGTVSGRCWFDPDSGTLVESMVDQSMHLHGGLAALPEGAPSPGNFTSDIGQRVTLKLVQ